MRKFFVALMLVASTMIVVPTAAEATPSHSVKSAAACVETSFWGRAFSLVFMRSYASYLWLVKC